MATAKKKTEAPSTRTAPRPQAERRVEAAPPARATRQPSHDAVARRAFELWEQEGRPPGRDREHWLQAEAELREA